MSHSNAPLCVEGRRRLVARCADRPIAHVAAEMGISRACASKWVNRFRMFGEPGLEDRASTPHHQPTATTAAVVAQIEGLRRTRKWSASRSTATRDWPVQTPPDNETTTTAIGFMHRARVWFTDNGESSRVRS